MARIRSIKPEFFDDEQLCALPFQHRLCFAGLWTQADKAGRMEDRPRRLKARIFPYDDVDMDALLADLERSGFVIRYQVASVPYLAIKPSGWMKHQRPRPDEPESLLPSVDPATVTDSPLRSVVAESAECLGKEGKGREGKGREDADGASDPEASDALADLWNDETVAPIARCQQVTAKRRRHMKARLTERPLTEWRDVFARIQASPFCRGQNDRGWVASFDWVVGSADVAVKVLEGKYDDRRKTPRSEPVYQDPDYCQHDPRCHSRTWHAAKTADEIERGVA